MFKGGALHFPPPPPLKHLAHKLSELLLQLVQDFLGSICLGRSCPLGKDFSAFLVPSSVDVHVVQNLSWFWSELSH